MKKVTSKKVTSLKLLLALAGLLTVGTTLGQIALVKDINDGSSWSYPLNLTNVNGTLFFTANDGINGVELWKSDGTAAGTVLVKDINIGGGWSQPEYLTAVGNVLYFSADDGVNSRELWKSDGTEAGTVMVKKILPSEYVGSSPQNLTNVNGTLFFSAEDGASGRELWKSDGTEAGTVLVKNINPFTGPGSVFFPSNPSNLVNVNGTLFFSADDGTHGLGLWKSDGTEAGTVLVSSINPGNLTNVNGTLFFVADGSGGFDDFELYKSDGTAAGTGRVRDIARDEVGSYPHSLTAVGNTLFFSVAEDASGHSNALWKSDGTGPGTQRVKLINPEGFTSSEVRNLVNVNGTLFFSANDGTNGQELWKSDGTEAGTVLVKNIHPGEGAGSAPGNLVNVGGTLYFTADDGTHGEEVWKSNGTAAGTALVRDLSPGEGGSILQQLTAVGNVLFMAARSGMENSPGLELYRTVTLGPCDFPITGLVGTFTSMPTVSLTPACAGSSIRLSFTASKTSVCPFSAFTAELSDASGSFAAPVALGSVNPGLNILTIPEGTPTGSGYRVRVVLSAPEGYQGQAYSNGSAVFSVNQPSFAAAPIVSGDNKCAGQGVRLSFSTRCTFFAGNTFTAYLSDASGAFPGGGTALGLVTPGALNNVVIPAGTPAGTTYKLRVVSSNPVVTSAASTNFKVKACTNREAAPEDQGLRVVVSPNPSPEGRLRINVSSAEGQALKVELFNGMGQSVREQTLPNAAFEEVLDWDVSRQPAGLYLLRVSGEKEAKTIKVLH